MLLERCKQCKSGVVVYWWKIWCNRGRGALTKEIISDEYKHVDECTDWEAKRPQSQLGRLADALEGFKKEEDGDE